MHLPRVQKKFLNNKWALAAAGTGLFTLVVLLLLPVASKYYLTKWLLANGADTAVIEKIRINPFAGSISLEGVDVTRDGDTVLSNTDISFNLSLMALFQKEADIEKAALDNLTIEIELYKDGRMRFGSYTTSPPSSNAPAAPASTAAPWTILANQLNLSNCRVRFKMPDLDMTLQVDEASLNRFTTAPGDKSGSFSLNGSLNGTPISLKLNTLRVEPDIVVQGSIQIDGFKLNGLANILKPYLNPFTGKVSTDGTVLFKLSDNGDMSADYDGMIGVDQGHISGNSFSVQGAALRWEKGPIHYALSDKKGTIIDVDGSLRGKKIAVDIPDPAINIREPALAIDGRVQVLINDEVKVETCAGFALKQLGFSMPPLQAEAADISWQGKDGCITFNSGTRDKELSVRAQGELTADHPSFSDRNGAIQLAVNGSSLSWNGAISYLPGLTDTAPSIMEANGSLNIAELAAQLKEPEISFAQKAFTLTTKGSIAVGGETTVRGTASFQSSGFTIVNDSSQAPLLTLEQFTIDRIEAPGGEKITIKQALADGLDVYIAGDMPLKVTIPTVTITDIQTDDLATLTTGELSARSPVVVATKNNKKLAGLGALKVHGIHTGPGQQVNVDQVDFDKFFFLGESAGKKDNICSIAEARLSELGWSPEKGMTGTALSFADLFCTLIRDKDGTFVLNKELAAMSNHPEKNKEKPAEKTEHSSPGSNIRLGRITLGGESGLYFEDHTLEVPFKSDLAITSLQVKNIDSANPSEPASVHLVGVVDKRAPLQISGTTAPFAAPAQVHMKLKLKNYPLADLSSYTVQSVGVALASGQLKLKSKLKLKENVLDMSNEIVLKKLKTRTISKELAEKLDNQLPIPLDSALSMLRDSDGNITLDVPLQGPVDKLNVGISDILITALSKAIVPAASGYLMYTLGPYGALAWVGMKVGEKMLEIRLPPVFFAPGESAVPDELKDYFDRLAKILKDKPVEDFQLCPKSSAWEYIAGSEKKTEDKKGPELSDKDKEKLMALGQERAANIKEYLIRNYGIDKDRLLICITRIETEKSAKPRVDIQM